MRRKMMALEYVPGESAYQLAERDPDLLLRLLPWAEKTIWKPVKARNTAEACDEFYREKTLKRGNQLPLDLRMLAREVLALFPWDEVVQGCQPVNFHGDFNLGNIISRTNSQGAWDGFTVIDWREEFARRLNWGDKRYDLGKLLAGLYVNWDNARRGDFQDWAPGQQHREKLAFWLGGAIPRDIKLIAGLSLLNCAPLHKPPLDKILVTTAAQVIGETLAS